jgi:acetyltransferase-like isoleucine patch superfamily enzyme
VNMRRALIGASGFAHEVRAYMRYFNISMFVDEKYWVWGNKNLLKMSQFDPKKYQVLVALGSSQFRSDVVGRMPINTNYFSFAHSQVYFYDNCECYGEGSIFCPGTKVTTNVKFGRHAQLNLNTTIGHNCVIGDFFTTAPGVNVSGDCIIGHRVYLGTNSAVREKTHICNDVTIGMDITEPGIYVGNPARRLK